MALDPLILSNLLVTIKTSIKNKKVDVNSAFAIIVEGMKVLETYKQLSGQQKKDYVFAVVQQLANGPDGVAGTNDDVLPQITVNALNAILRENILGSFVNIIVDATKGKFDINKTVKTTVSCLGICFK